jgi:hypothetical protein
MIKAFAKLVEPKKAKIGPHSKGEDERPPLK